MSLVVLQGVSIGFGKQQLIDGLDLRLGARDRIGLCGPNGSGKTSLLRVLAGEATADAGKVQRVSGLRVGYLPQDTEEQRGDETILHSVLRSVPGRAELEEEHRRAETDLAAAEKAADEEAMMDAATRLADVTERQTRFAEIYSEHEAHKILSGLGFDAAEHERELGELSGGWRMRARLAGLLFQRPDLLLLDEPTNHLDLPTVAWFSSFLRRYPHAFVLICHDREFLDEQIDRVLSLEPEGLRQFRGNFAEYAKQRAEEEIILENEARNLQREREKAERFIERFRAQANKAKAVQSRIKQLEKLENVQLFERRRKMQFSFPACQRAGDVVLRTEQLKQAFGDLVVFDGVDLFARRGEKIGIIGVNGAGKTTLLRTVAGELGAAGGRVELGHKVKVGYYAQHHADHLDPQRTIFDEVASRNTAEGTTAVRTLLGAFLFSDDDVDKPVGVLSGGERARVALAKMLIDPGNVLLMDEPTNHLDLESSESLAESLSTFEGTLIFVSHNRSFVRKLATRIWDVAQGGVETYPGTLDDYLARHENRAETDAELLPVKAAPSPRPKAPRSGESRASRRERRREEAQRRADAQRRLGPLQKRVAELEARIEELETRQRERNLALADPATYEDASRRETLLREHRADAEALAETTEAWELAQTQLEDAEAETGSPTS